MPMPLDTATLPRKMTALRSLLLQREAEHAEQAQLQATELERQSQELQAARAGLQEQVLRNELLKARLARLLRERFGASSDICASQSVVRRENIIRTSVESSPHLRVLAPS